MLPEQRRREILTLLAESGGVDVPRLASRLAVSPATVRRDLALLEEHGQLERTHGGAVSSGQSTAFEPRYAEKRNRHTVQKQAIAREALELIEDGHVVVLDSGSTTFALARELHRRRGLTVITVDLKIAIELAEVPGFDVIVVGGRVRPELFGVVGPMTQQTLAELHADVAFLGADAISITEGVTNASLDEVAIKRAIVATAHHTFVLADASKFGHVSLAKVADVQRFTALITDPAIDPQTLKTFNDAGARLTLARP